LGLLPQGPKKEKRDRLNTNQIKSQGEKKKTDPDGLARNPS